MFFQPRKVFAKKQKRKKRKSSIKLSLMEKISIKNALSNIFREGFDLLHQGKYVSFNMCVVEKTNVHRSIRRVDRFSFLFHYISIKKRTDRCFIVAHQTITEVTL